LCVHFLGRRPQSFPTNPAPGARPARGRLPPRDPIALSKLYASARATMRGGASKRRPWGRWFRRWGGGRGGRVGCKLLQSVAARHGAAVPVAKSFSLLPLCFTRPARAATRWAAWLKDKPAVDRQALRALRERGEEAKSVRSEFGSCPALFGIVTVCSASSFEVKLMEEFLKYSEIASARPPRPTVGGHLRQIATHCGDLRYQPKPRRHSAADNGRVRSRDLRANRETSPGEIHGA